MPILHTSRDRAADFANRPGCEKPKAFGLRSEELLAQTSEKDPDRFLASGMLLLLLFGRAMRFVSLVVHG